MGKYKFIIALLTSALMVTAAYCQENPVSPLIKIVKGTVTNTDSAGNIISIRTDDQRQMVFSVPDKAIITQETRNIGLMDIGKSDSVTIQYYVLSPVKSVLVSIVDNEPVINE